MTNYWLMLLSITPLTVGCAGDPNSITIDLAPQIISSLDGTLELHAIVLADGEPVGKGKAINFTVDYTDRNAMAHVVMPIDGTTDDNGAFSTKISDLTWDGTGTIHATSGAAVGEATFAVLDRTPPKVTITPPAQVRINMNAQFMIHITDEIGVSEVHFEASGGGNNGGNNNGRTTVISSGSTDATVNFNYQANDTQVGQVITFYALASDLSNNLAAAAPVMVTIAP